MKTPKIKSVPFVLLFCLSLLIALSSSACAKHSASAEEAIAHAETLEKRDVRIVYLVGQAEYFLKAGMFKDAAQAAEYILRSLDADSKIADSILQRAKIGLSKQQESR